MADDTSLAAVQRLFWRVLTHPTGAADFVATRDDATRACLEAVFDESPDFRRVERLEVYAQAYFFRLLDALRETFPRLEQRLGSVAFHDTITDYLLAHPSTEPDLGRLGQRLPGFLHEAVTTRSRPELADLARVEWAIRELLDGPDEPVLVARELAALAPAELLELRCAPACSARLLDLAVSFPELEPRPSRVLVWRWQLRVYTRTLSLAEGTMLSELWQGRSFASACDAADRSGARPEDVAAYLARWLADGLLVRAASAS